MPWREDPGSRDRGRRANGPAMFTHVSQVNYNTPIIIFHNVTLLKLDTVKDVALLQIILDLLATKKNERGRATLVFYEPCGCGH